MSVDDPMTARLLAERMVNSFFDGLSEVERRQIISGGDTASRSTAFSMLAYTLNVYLGELNLSEEMGREFFQEAIRKKIAHLRTTVLGEKSPDEKTGKARDDEKT